MLAKSEPRKIAHSAFTENSLYHYSNDNQRLLSSSLHLNIESSSLAHHTREAIYIRLPRPTTLSTRETWQLNEQHLTIDRYINHHVTVFSPSHFTQIYLNKAQNNKQATVHVYFDHQGQIKPQIHTKVIDTSSENDQTVAHDFVENQDFIMEQAQLCQKTLMTILREKANNFIELTKKSWQTNHQLALDNDHIFTAASDVIKTQAIQHATVTSQLYLDQLNQLMRYSDTSLDYTQYQNIHHYITMVFARLQQWHIKPTTTAPSDHLHEEEIAIIPLDSPLKPMVISTCTHEKNQLIARIDQLLLTTRTDNLIAYFEHLETIQYDLLSLELSYPREKVQHFIATQRTRLPREDLHTFFLNLCLTGELEKIQLLYPYIRFKTDMMPIFAHLIDAIMHKNTQAPMESLIQVTDFFYEHSTEYNAYLIIENSKFFQSSTTLGHIISLLILACTTDNFPAFQMHLRQGRSPNAVHLFEKSIALNALQSILFLYPTLTTSCLKTTPIHRYIEALFKYGAHLNTSKLYDAHTSCAVKFDDLMETEHSLTNMVSHIHAVHKATSAAVSPVSSKKRTAHLPHQSTPLRSVSQVLNAKQGADSSANDELLDRLSNASNLLTFSLTSLSLPDDLVTHLATHASLKTSLNALFATLYHLTFIKINAIGMTGGLHVFPTKTHAVDYMYTLENLPYTNSATFKLLFIINDRSDLHPDEQHRLLLKTEHAYNRFKTLYLQLTVTEKRALIRELQEELIRKKLANEPFIEQIVVAEAIFLALTLIPDPCVKDYVSLCSAAIHVMRIRLEHYNNPKEANHLCNKLDTLLKILPLNTQTAIIQSQPFITLHQQLQRELPLPMLVIHTTEQASPPDTIDAEALAVNSLFSASSRQQAPDAAYDGPSPSV